jgi:hypothetical protein
MRLSRAIAILSALLSAAPAAAQMSKPHDPIKVDGVFQEDLPDVNMAKVPELKDALKNAQSCPGEGPRAQILIVNQSREDPAFVGPLYDARINGYPPQGLKGLKQILDMPESVTYSLSAQVSGKSYVQVSFDGKDTDPPALQVHSVPPKGSVVTAGQTIALTIRASELLDDGHKSWPSGVQLIQLTDNNGLVKAWEYGKPPQPCVVQNETWSYKVPDSPPPIVHLLVETEDAVGNQVTKTADFPTAPWYGTIKAHGQGNVYNDTVNIDFAFSVGADGVVTGKGHAKETNAPQQFPPGCVIQTLVRTPDELDVAVSGRLVDNQFVLKLEEPTVNVIATNGGCGTGRSLPVRMAFFAPMPLAPDFRNLMVRAKDGATNSFDVVVGPQIHITGSIEIHQSKLSGN